MIWFIVWAIIGVVGGVWTWTNRFDLNVLEAPFVFVLCVIGGPIVPILWIVADHLDGRPKKPPMALIKGRKGTGNRR